ncbi:MAG: radical SAM protein [Candidatus Omnitrophica bacterium]|nr:radical SAM protein [Candidatus Omnitrophota bacterium]
MNKITDIALPLLWHNLFRPNDPFFATFMVSWRCNAKCIMCDVWKKQSDGEMSTETIINMFKQLKHVKILRLTGGEPFLHTGMKDIVNALYAKTNIKIIHVTSNGFLTDRIVEFVEGIKHPNVHIKISLNGVGENYNRIMGIPGAYDKVMKTVKSLVDLKDRYPVVFGINQTITDKEAYEDSKILRKMCLEYDIPYLPVIAYEPVALYDQNAAMEKSKAQVSKITFKPFGTFSDNELRDILQDFQKETHKIKNPIERTVKHYYLKGLTNRIIQKKSKPHPKCVALRRHIRIMPTGDVITCLHNTTRVGNLQHESFRNIWSKPETTKMRVWVDRCSGCWAECETIPSASFSLDSIPPVLEALLK